MRPAVLAAMLEPRKGAVVAGADGKAVAVLGAGIMGSAMARNLVAAGLTTTVWDRSASSAGPLADAGAVVAASARDAVQGAGVVITMLPTADVVDSVIFEGGVADAFADGCVWAGAALAAICTFRCARHDMEADTMSRPETCRIAARPADYLRYGIAQGRQFPWCVSARRPPTVRARWGCPGFRRESR
jgi:hypothetical protein